MHLDEQKTICWGYKQIFRESERSFHSKSYEKAINNLTQPPANPDLFVYWLERIRLDWYPGSLCPNLTFAFIHLHDMGECAEKFAFALLSIMISESWREIRLQVACLGCLECVSKWICGCVTMSIVTKLYINKILLNWIYWKCSLNCFKPFVHSLYIKRKKKHFLVIHCKTLGYGKEDPGDFMFY